MKSDSMLFSDVAIKRTFLLLASLIFTTVPSLTQVKASTAEDKVTSGTASTSVGGYGNAFYQYDFNEKTSVMDLERMVLFVGHQFNPSIAFFSELEVEDAKVTGGESGGEVAFEQAYVKFALGRRQYITAGLFLPEIGILNIDHLPTSFNGNERTQVETYILPSTWRELGVGYYGSFGGVPLSYELAVVNGLNSASFEHGSGIREGRFEGRNASANNLAVTGALKWDYRGFIAQASGYYGGTVGLSTQSADSLGLSSGPFGTPVAIGEADVRYTAGRFGLRALGAIVSIPDAFQINQAYNNNTPQREYGAYGELSYNVLNPVGPQALILFARYEILDMNAAIPTNGILDETLKQQHIIAGLSYFPLSNVVVKADVRLMQTGDANPILFPTTVSQYKRNNTFINAGIGFSF